MKISRFRTLRIITGKSQVEIAKEAGITQAFVSLIETKKAIPIGETRKKLAAIVGDDPDELFKER